jgi:hypothetical protein
MLSKTLLRLLFTVQLNPFTTITEAISNFDFHEVMAIMLHVYVCPYFVPVLT